MCLIKKWYANFGGIFKKFEKRGTLLGPTFFVTLFCQKHGKNSAATQ